MQTGPDQDIESMLTEMLLRRVARDIAAGRLDDALHIARTVKLDHPELPAAHYLLYQVHRKAGEDETAGRFLRRAEKLDPNISENFDQWLYKSGYDTHDNRLLNEADAERNLARSYFIIAIIVLSLFNFAFSITSWLFGAHDVLLMFLVRQLLLVVLFGLIYFINRAVQLLEKRAKTHLRSTVPDQEERSD